MALTTRSAHRIAPSDDRVGRDPTVSCWAFSTFAEGTPAEMLLATLSRSHNRVVVVMLDRDGCNRLPVRPHAPAVDTGLTDNRPYENPDRCVGPLRNDLDGDALIRTYGHK